MKFHFPQPRELSLKFAASFINTEDKLEVWRKAIGDITPDSYLEEVGNDISFSAIRGMVLAPYQLTKYGVALTEAAKSKAQEIYREAIKRPEISNVVIRIGPTASGKSTMTRTLGIRGDSEGTLVYEDHLDSLDNVIKLVDEARADGLSVDVEGFYREPLEAFNSVIQRAKETGKIVPVDYAAETYRTFEANWPKLVQSLKDKRSVTISLFNNSFGVGNAKEISPEELPKTNTTNLEKNFQQQLEAAKEEKVISPTLYNQFNAQRSMR